MSKTGFILGNKLKKCDTEELQCFVCTGRDSCPHDALVLPTLHTNICHKCHRIYFSQNTVTTKTTSQTVNQMQEEDNLCLKCISEEQPKGAIWVELYSRDTILKQVPEVQSYFKSLDKNVLIKEDLLNEISKRVLALMKEDEVSFPFRSGYNLAVCFKRQASMYRSLLASLIPQSIYFDKMVTIYCNFFETKPDDVVNPIKDITNDTEVFAHFGEKIAHYESLINNLQALLSDNEE